MKLPIIILLFSCALSFGQRTDFNRFDFSKADSIAKTLKGQELTNLPDLVYGLTHPLETEAEKFRAIYTWICTNIENDYSAYLRTVKKRKKLAKDKEAFLEWNDNYKFKVIQKLVKDKKTACTGYAYLVREMATLADINCKIIDGYGRTATLHLNSKSIPNHSWNSMQLHGEWYLCDATWSAGQIIFENESPVFKSEYHDGYFMANPALFVKNHFPLEEDWTLLPTPPTFTQFTEGPVIYKEAFTQKVVPITPETMNIQTVKHESVSFILEVPRTFKSESIALVLNNGGSRKSVTPEVILKQNVCELKYSFDRLGSYDVHIELADKIVATYVVKVKRG